VLKLAESTFFDGDRTEIHFGFGTNEVLNSDGNSGLDHDRFRRKRCVICLLFVGAYWFCGHGSSSIASQSAASSGVPGIGQIVYFGEEYRQSML
jgi:hypothetical protein